MCAKYDLDPREESEYNQTYTNVQSWLPEHTLLSKIVARAVIDLFSNSEYVRKKAICWINEAKQEYDPNVLTEYAPYSLIYCLSELAIDPTQFFRSVDKFLVAAAPASSEQAQGVAENRRARMELLKHWRVSPQAWYRQVNNQRQGNVK